MIWLLMKNPNFIIKRTLIRPLNPLYLVKNLKNTNKNIAKTKKNPNSISILISNK